MIDPLETAKDWLQLINPGGHLVVTVPDWCLYEGMVWPSRYNPDHKSSWSMWIKDSPAPIHILVPDFCKSLGNLARTRLCRLVDSNYDYKVGTRLDQTWPEDAGVEAFCEFVLQKR
jgi:hypothetical protein